MWPDDKIIQEIDLNEINKHERVDIKDDAFASWATVQKVKHIATDEWKACVKDDKQYKELVLAEIFFQFCLHYFGDDFVGWNALGIRKSWMRSLRFDYHHHGI